MRRCRAFICLARLASRQPAPCRARDKRADHAAPVWARNIPMRKAWSGRAPSIATALACARQQSSLIKPLIKPLIRRSNLILPIQPPRRRFSSTRFIDRQGGPVLTTHAVSRSINAVRWRHNTLASMASKGAILITIVDPIVEIGERLKLLRVVPPMILLTAAAFSAEAQNTLPQLKPFTSICIVDDSIGFSFLGGRTNRTTFPAFTGTRYIARKIDPQLYKNSDTRDTAYSLCDYIKPTRFRNGSTLTHACYDIRDPTFTSPIARTCTEKWDPSGSLAQITCDDLKFAFHPSGPFVQMSSVGIDSVVSLDTGKCSLID